MDLLEALYTTRAMRRVETTPVPDEVVAAMMDAAIRAPSGGNSQNWRFVTVVDPIVRDSLADLYGQAYELLYSTVYQGRRERAQEAGDEAALRVMRSSRWLADHAAEVPLWVLAFSRNDPTGASIYPAVWSMMLAARAHGVGTCLTTILGVFKQAEVGELLGVPPGKGWVLNAAVSAGYPTGRWGLAVRRPPQEVVYADRWGQEVGWRVDRPRWEEPAGYGG